MLVRKRLTKIQFLNLRNSKSRLLNRRLKKHHNLNNHHFTMTVKSYRRGILRIQIDRLVASFIS